MENTRAPGLYCVWGGGKFEIRSCVLERLCGLTGRRHLIRHPADSDTPDDTFSSRRRLGAGDRKGVGRPYGGGRDARMPLSVTSASRRDSSPRRGSQERRHLRRGRRVHIPTPVCRRAMLGATGQPLRQGGKGRADGRRHLIRHPPCGGRRMPPSPCAGKAWGGRLIAAPMEEERMTPPLSQGGGQVRLIRIPPWRGAWR